MSASENVVHVYEHARRRSFVCTLSQLAGRSELTLLRWFVHISAAAVRRHRLNRAVRVGFMNDAWR